MRENLFATNATKALQMVRMLFEQGDRLFVVERFVTFFTTEEEEEEEIPIGTRRRSTYRWRRIGLVIIISEEKTAKGENEFAA